MAESDLERLRRETAAKVDAAKADHRQAIDTDKEFGEAEDEISSRERRGLREGHKSDLYGKLEEIANEHDDEVRRLREEGE